MIARAMMVGRPEPKFVRFSGTRARGYVTRALLGPNVTAAHKPKAAVIRGTVKQSRKRDKTTK